MATLLRPDQGSGVALRFFRARARRGFTLIELLIVIAIIGILAVAAASSYSSARSKAANAVAQADVTQLSQAVEAFRAANDEKILLAWGSHGDTLTGPAETNKFASELFSGRTGFYEASVAATPSRQITFTYSTVHNGCSGGATTACPSSPPCPSAGPCHILSAAGESYVISTSLLPVWGSYSAGLGYYVRDGSSDLVPSTPSSFIPLADGSRDPSTPVVGPTPTPTATPSSTPTATPSALPTSTPTATASPLPTATPSSPPTATPGPGTAYYISPSGSDSPSAGSLGSPFRTFSYAFAKLRPGDTLYVRGGDYAQDISMTPPAGTAAARILVSNYPGERPVIHGLVWLTSPSYWTFHGLNVTWLASGHTYDEHMIRLLGGTGWTWEYSEVWGAQSFANVLVGNSPSNWTLQYNVIHDDVGGIGPSGTVDHYQNHNIYVNTGTGAGNGLIEHNLFYNALNGEDIKLAGPAQTGGTVNVTVRYNTLYNANRALLIGSAGSTNNLVEYNILDNGQDSGSESYVARLYQVDATGRNTFRNNAFFNAKSPSATGRAWCSDLQSSLTCDKVDGGGNVFPQDPRFNCVNGAACFVPQDTVAAKYGYYAGR